MIVKEEFLKKLRSAFDLNIYEVKIWTALLSKGIATAGELSDISNVPRSRCYDVLETLEKKGFVVMKLGKPIKYIAVSPDDIINRVKKGLKLNTEEKLNMLDNVKGTNAYSELDLLYKQGIEHIEPSSLSGLIKGRNNIYDHLTTMIENAKKNVIIGTTPKGFLRKIEILKPIFKKLKNKGVEIKIAVPFTKEVRDNLNEIKGLAEVKDIKNNARFILVDGKELMFMLMHDDKVHESYDTGVWVDTPYFTSALESLFELSWKEECQR